MLPRKTGGYLHQRNGKPGWYLAVEVPPNDRELVGGKARLVRSLGTRDRNEAERRRFAAYADMLRELQARKKSARGLPAGLARDPLGWRYEIAAQEDADDRSTFELLAHDRAEELENEQGLPLCTRVGQHRPWGRRPRGNVPRALAG